MSIYKMIHKPLSDADIKHILGSDAKILEYFELNKYSDLVQLLPNPIDFVIILYEEQRLSGHWTCLARRDDLFTFFDSYGLAPDAELKWFSPKQRRELGEEIPRLSQLLRNKQYVYNRHAFQSHNTSVETCGSHVCMFLYCFVREGFTLEQYQQFMKQLSKATHETADQIVARFTGNMLQRT